MTTLTRDEIIVCLQKLNVVGITVYQQEGIRQACEMIMRLKEIEHLAWHVCESSSEDSEYGDIRCDKADFYALSKLLPEDHPT